MAAKYLLDTNICIHLLRNRKEVVRAIENVGWSNCFISEMTVVELFYGAECSNDVEQNRALVQSLLNDIGIVPLFDCIQEYCRQKARLRSLGQLIEDFDLFIGSTAVAMKYILVTENIKHLSRLTNIHLENWVER